MARRRTRYLRRNPTTTTWLLLGGAVAAIGGYYLYQKYQAGKACKAAMKPFYPHLVKMAKLAGACQASASAPECAQLQAYTPILMSNLPVLAKSCGVTLPPNLNLPSPPQQLPAVEPISDDCSTRIDALQDIAMNEAKILGTNPSDADVQKAMQTVLPLLQALVQPCGLPPSLLANIPLLKT